MFNPLTSIKRPASLLLALALLTGCWQRVPEASQRLTDSARAFLEIVKADGKDLTCYSHEKAGLCYLPLDVVRLKFLTQGLNLRPYDLGSEPEAVSSSYLCPRSQPRVHFFGSGEELRKSPGPLEFKSVYLSYVVPRNVACFHFQW